jgi:hypothetical protein
MSRPCFLLDRGQTPQLSKDLPLSLRVLHRKENRIISRDGSQDLRPGKSVERDRNMVGFSRRGVEHHQSIARPFHRKHAFADPLLIRISPRGSRSWTSIGPVHFYQPERGDVPADRRLSDLPTQRGERICQLLLGPHRSGADELENLEVAFAAVSGHVSGQRGRGAVRAAFRAAFPVHRRSAFARERSTNLPNGFASSVPAVPDYRARPWSPAAR